MTRRRGRRRRRSSPTRRQRYLVEAGKAIELKSLPSWFWRVPSVAAPRRENRPMLRDGRLRWQSSLLTIVGVLARSRRTAGRAPAEGEGAVRRRDRDRGKRIVLGQGPQAADDDDGSSFFRDLHEAQTRQGLAPPRRRRPRGVLPGQRVSGREGDAARRSNCIENGAFADIVIRIDEGEPTRVDVRRVRRHRTRFRRNELAKELRLKPGVPFNPTLVNADVYAMKRQYFDKGYLAVEIDDSVAVDGKSVRLFYRIDPGPVVTIRRIEITGNRLTKDYGSSSRNSPIKEGETFPAEQGRRDPEEPFRDGTVHRGGDPPGEPRREGPYRGRQRPGPRKKVRATSKSGLGVGNILGSRVTGEWGDKNLFGTGKEARAQGGVLLRAFRGGSRRFREPGSAVKYYRYDAEFAERHIFGSRFHLGGQCVPREGRDRRADHHPDPRRGDRRRCGT